MFNAKDSQAVLHNLDRVLGNKDVPAILVSLETLLVGVNNYKNRRNISRLLDDLNDLLAEEYTCEFLRGVWVAAQLQLSVVVLTNCSFSTILLADNDAYHCAVRLCGR